METIRITPEVLGLIINNLCYQTRIVYPVSKAGTQGFTLGALRELFPKILHPRLPWDSSSSSILKNVFNIKKREKITWSLQSIGFHSNFIFFKLLKILFFKQQHVGGIKTHSLSTWVNCRSAQRYVHPVLRTQEQFWPFCLELGISPVMDFPPTVLLGFLW